MNFAVDDFDFAGGTTADEVPLAALVMDFGFFDTAGTGLAAGRVGPPSSESLVITLPITLDFVLLLLVRWMSGVSSLDAESSIESAA